MNIINIKTINKSKGSRVRLILLPFVILVSLITGCGSKPVMMLGDAQNESAELADDESATESEEGLGDIPGGQEQEYERQDAVEPLTGMETGVSEGGEINKNERVFVYVCGSVNREGVYELDSGSRIIDGIDAAGGFSENACTSYINLSARINDEDMVYVPSMEEVKDRDGNVITSVMPVTKSVTEGYGRGNTVDERVNINTASQSELMALKGIGEAKAKAIIEYRETKGAFMSPEDIMKVNGIGEGYYSKIKDSIRVK